MSRAPRNSVLTPSHEGRFFCAWHWRWRSNERVSVDLRRFFGGDFTPLDVDLPGLRLGVGRSFVCHHYRLLSLVKRVHIQTGVGVDLRKGQGIDVVAVVIMDVLYVFGVPS